MKKIEMRNALGERTRDAAESSPSLPRGHAFWVVAYAFAATVMGSTVPAPLYEVYQSRWNFSNAVLTIIFATYAGGVVLALLLFGQLSDRIGRRPVLLGGIAAGACGIFVFFIAQGVAWLIIARVLTGIAVGLSMGTATALLTELHPRTDARAAALVGTISSVIGFGSGPLLAGVLVQYAFWPIRLVFLVCLALLIAAFVGMRLVPETVQKRQEKVSWRPQSLRVPGPIRAPFAIASTTLFCGFAMLGLFTSLAPSLATNLLHVHNQAINGALVSIVFVISVSTQLTFKRVMSQTAIVSGAALLIFGLLLLLLALSTESILIYLCSIVCLGTAYGFSYMGSLALVNVIAPSESRAEVLSSYFVVGYCGTALPVLGLGFATGFLGFYGATVAFVLFISLLSFMVIVGMVVRKFFS